MAGKCSTHLAIEFYVENQGEMAELTRKKGWQSPREDKFGVPNIYEGLSICI